jgi:hypothetical protein
LERFTVGRDDWLRRAPLMAMYHRLVFGEDFAHRPDAAIRELFEGWGVPAGGGTGLRDAVAAASLTLGLDP